MIPVSPRAASPRLVVQILKFFSYEHFYVIYCKFWELDQDHDFLLDKNDLAHYSNCALSYVIVDRIFEEVGARPGARARVRAAAMHGMNIAGAPVLDILGRTVCKAVTHACMLRRKGMAAEFPLAE